MNTYIADIEGDSLREVVLYIDHLAEIAALKEELRLALLRGDSLDRVVGECGQREIALQARVKDLEAFATNIGDCGYVKDCRRIKELEGALNCKPQMEAKP